VAGGAGAAWAVGDSAGGCGAAGGEATRPCRVACLPQTRADACVLGLACPARPRLLALANPGCRVGAVASPKAPPPRPCSRRAGPRLAAGPGARAPGGDHPAARGRAQAARDGVHRRRCGCAGRRPPPVSAPACLVLALQRCMHLSGRAQRRAHQALAGLWGACCRSGAGAFQGRRLFALGGSLRHVRRLTGAGTLF